MYKLLITGFEPFGGDTENPSEILVNNLSEERYEQINIKKVILPVTVKEAGKQLVEALDAFKPDTVLSLGLNAGLSHIAVERVALNMIDARIKDNNGDQPVDRPVVKEGETAFFSTLPTREMVRALRKEKIPAKLSYTAGTYVCNVLFYAAMHAARKREHLKRCGFVHIPYTHEQVLTKPGRASLSMATLESALDVIVRTLYP